MLALQPWETSNLLLRASVFVGGLLMLLGLLAAWRIVSVLATPGPVRSGDARPSSARGPVAVGVAAGTTMLLLGLAVPATYKIYKDLFQTTSLETPLATEGAPHVALYDVDRDGNADMMSLAPSEEITGARTTERLPTLVPLPKDTGGTGTLIAIAVISALGGTLAAAAPKLIDTVGTGKREQQRAPQAPGGLESTVSDDPDGS